MWPQRSAYYFICWCELFFTSTTLWPTSQSLGMNTKLKSSRSKSDQSTPYVQNRKSPASNHRRQNNSNRRPATRTVTCSEQWTGGWGESAEISMIKIQSSNELVFHTQQKIELTKNNTICKPQKKSDLYMFFAIPCTILLRVHTCKGGESKNCRPEVQHMWRGTRFRKLSINPNCRNSLSVTEQKQQCQVCHI